MDRPIKQVFLSYSHKDENYKDELESHLSLLLLLSRVETWSDRLIHGGQVLFQEIKDNIKSADIVLMLISADYLSSRSCREEMQTALERSASNTSIAIPIIIRPCDWTILPLKDILSVPRDGLPVSKWLDRDEAWTDVVKNIRLLLEDWQVATTSLSETSDHKDESVFISEAVSDQITLNSVSSKSMPQQWVFRKDVNEADWRKLKEHLLSSLLSSSAADSTTDIKIDGRRWGDKLIVDAQYPRYINPRRILVDDISGAPGYPGYQLEIYARDGLNFPTERVRWIITPEGTRVLMRLRPQNKDVYNAESYAAHLWELIKAANTRANPDG